MTSNVAAQWTPEREEALRRLWKDGHSNAHIAAKLGGGATRNSVAGKAHRLKLSPRPRITEQQPTVRARAHAKNASPKALVFETVPLPEEELGNDVTALLGIMDLTNDTCRYMHGDPKGQHGYCGKQTQPGSSWCPHHHHVVFGGRP